MLVRPLTPPVMQPATAMPIYLKTLSVIIRAKQVELEPIKLQLLLNQTPLSCQGLISTMSAQPPITIPPKE